MADQVNPIQATASLLDKSAVEQQHLVSVHFENEPLPRVLHELARKVNVGISYDTEIVPSKLITYEGKNKSVYAVLGVALEGTGLYVTLSKNKKVIVIKEQPVQQLQKIQEKVSGTVTDAESGETLPGVNILVKGSSTGTSTDAEGQFELDAPSLQDTLVVTYIGYQQQEVPINGRSDIDIQLTPKAIMGEEMVVVGYGTQESGDVTGSVSRVSSEHINRSSISNFQQSLKGQVSGVRVTQNTGSPSAGVTLKIRGFNSITAGSQPLYVIDGQPISGGGTGTGIIPGSTNPLNSINPNEIESIDILKDASAAAIYGSQGANGVVIITTKSGSAENQMIQFDMSTGWQHVTKKMDRLNPEEFADYHKESRYNGWIRSGGDPDTPNGERGAFNVTDIYYNPSEWNRTDWQDEIFRTGMIQNYNISASGGTDDLRYAISGGYSENQGIIIETSMKRYSFRSNIDAKLSEKLNVGLRVNPSYSVHNLQNTEGHFQNSTVNKALVAAPIVSPYSEDGSYTNLLAMRNSTGLGSVGAIANSVAQAKEDQYDLESGRIIGNTFLEYQVLDNLSFKTSLGIDGAINRVNVFLSSKTNRGAQAPPNDPEGDATSSQEITWLNENVLSFQETFYGRHELKAILGNSFQKNDTKNMRLSGRQFPGDQVPYLSAAGTIESGTVNRYQWSMLSFYSRINYSYDSRYLVTATLRRDGSSRFGGENKYGTFPSVALGWRMSEEKFLEDLEFISDLKWRLSYGLSGNNSIPNYAHASTVSYGNYVLGPEQDNVNATYASSLANSYLTWETNRSYNIGLDLGLFGGRLELTADAYHSITDGLLLDVNIPAVSGFTSTLENVGEVQNRGLELAIKSVNSTGTLFWDSSFNISFNRNKVTELGGSAGDFIDGGPWTRTVVGKPLSQFYVRVTDGVFNSQEEIDAHVPQDNNPRPGDRRFKDVNGDGKVDNNDEDFVGGPNPDFTFGFTNNFSFKGFSLSVLIDGSYGNEIWHTYSVGANLNGNTNQDAWVYRNRWQSPEEPGNGNVPAPVYGFRTLTDVHSDFFVHDGSYLRLSNITLGYNLPSTIAQKAGLKNVRLTLTGQNLYTLTNYPGFDPEIGSSGSDPLNFGTGENMGVYPLARVISAGISLTF